MSENPTPARPVRPSLAPDAAGPSRPRLAADPDAPAIEVPAADGPARPRLLPAMPDLPAVPDVPLRPLTPPPARVSPFGPAAAEPTGVDPIVFVQSDEAPETRMPVRAFDEDEEWTTTSGAPVAAPVVVFDDADTDWTPGAARPASGLRAVARSAGRILLLLWLLVPIAGVAVFGYALAGFLGAF